MGFPLCFGLTIIAFFFAPPEKEGAVMAEDEVEGPAVVVLLVVMEAAVVDAAGKVELVEDVLLTPKAAALRDETEELAAVDGKNVVAELEAAE